MKETGIIRRVDELGRLVLPIELRRFLEIDERDPVEIFLQDDCVILRKYRPTCIFCGASSDLLEYRGRQLCRACLSALILQSD